MRGDRRVSQHEPADQVATEALIFDGDLESVRAGLMDLFAIPLLAGLSDNSRGAVEIVLAEVMNNIAEHAYASFPGKIEVWITAHDGFLFVRVADTGLPMPGGEPPGGKPNEAAEVQNLPEGGFGWFLIRSLTQGLTYRREGGHNRLSFCMGVEYRV